jgi:hypothetical protein
MPGSCKTVKVHAALLLYAYAEVHLTSQAKDNWSGAVPKTGRCCSVSPPTLCALQQHWQQPWPAAVLVQNMMSCTDMASHSCALIQHHNKDYPCMHVTRQPSHFPECTASSALP